MGRNTHPSICMTGSPLCTQSVCLAGLLGVHDHVVSAGDHFIYQTVDAAAELTAMVLQQGGGIFYRQGVTVRHNFLTCILNGQTAVSIGCIHIEIAFEHADRHRYSNRLVAAGDVDHIAGTGIQTHTLAHRAVCICHVGNDGAVQSDFRFFVQVGSEAHLSIKLAGVIGSEVRLYRIEVKCKITAITAANMRVTDQAGVRCIIGHTPTEARTLVHSKTIIVRIICQRIKFASLSSGQHQALSVCFRFSTLVGGINLIPVITGLTIVVGCVKSPGIVREQCRIHTGGIHHKEVITIDGKLHDINGPSIHLSPVFSVAHFVAFLRSHYAGMLHRHKAAGRGIASVLRNEEIGHLGIRFPLITCRMLRLIVDIEGMFSRRSQRDQIGLRNGHCHGQDCDITDDFRLRAGFRHCSSDGHLTAAHSRDVCLQRIACVAGNGGDFRLITLPDHFVGLVSRRSNGHRIGGACTQRHAAGHFRLDFSALDGELDRSARSHGIANGAGVTRHVNFLDGVGNIRKRYHTIAIRLRLYQQLIVPSVSPVVCRGQLCRSDNFAVGKQLDLNALRRCGTRSPFLGHGYVLEIGLVVADRSGMGIVLSAVLSFSRNTRGGIFALILQICPLSGY